MTNDIETVIIGGGQGGLAASYALSQRGRPHIVLERASTPGHVWRDERWDSFTLVTPNWAIKLPGGEYAGDDPNGYLSRAALGAYFDHYVQRHRLPIRYGVAATAVKRSPAGGYTVTTGDEVYAAKNVVMATGLFQRPKLPAYAADLPASIEQLHSTQYRRPGQLPPGAVLVVGSGQSGCQIAEELYQSGRRVYMSIGSTGRAPRRYRGRDVYEWLVLSGFMERTPDKLPSPRAKYAGNPHVSGKDGGHGLNLHQFARDGVVLLGRVQGADARSLTLAPDLKENLARADKFEADVLRLIDGYIAGSGLAVPSDEVPALSDGYAADELRTLNFASAGIRTIIWAAGYRFDFGLVDLPVFDPDGFPNQTNGVTAYPGLYFAGLPWLPAQKTGLLLGVGENAAFVAEHIAGRRE